MLTFRKVAVTGGLASGKSTVCQLLNELCIKKGFASTVVSADQIVQKLLNPNTELGRALLELLLSYGIHEDNVIKMGFFDNKALASILFQNEPLLKSWEAMIHPFVKNEIERVFQESQKPPLKKGFFIAEIPLLFEVKDLSRNFDVTVTVLCNESTAKERYCQKGGSLEDYNLRSRHQMPEKEKGKLATHILINDGDKNFLKQEVEKLFSRITEEL